MPELKVTVVAPGSWKPGCAQALTGSRPAPEPVPGTVAAITIGPPNFSCPLVTSRACSLYRLVPFSSVFAVTYIVPLSPSITGVLVIPAPETPPLPQPTSPGERGGPSDIGFQRVAFGS